MPAEDQDTVVFLIERQAELADAMKRDVEDPATISQLAHRVDTVERLKLLTIVTYAAAPAMASNTMSAVATFAVVPCAVRRTISSSPITMRISGHRLTSS